MTAEQRSQDATIGDTEEGTERDRIQQVLESLQLKKEDTGDRSKWRWIHVAEGRGSIQAWGAICIKYIIYIYANFSFKVMPLHFPKRWALASVGLRPASRYLFAPVVHPGTPLGYFLYLDISAPAGFAWVSYFGLRPVSAVAPLHVQTALHAIVSSVYVIKWLVIEIKICLKM